METDSSFGQYTTLSHCWGELHALKTEGSNLAQFQKGIPAALLPKTYQQAIVLTRMLKIPYI